MPMGQRAEASAPETHGRARRRLLVTGLGGLGALAGVRMALAELLATAPQPRGPFYPLALPLDSDNDLTRIEGKTGQASGTIVDITGQVLSPAGMPLSAVRVEIWQVNAWGRYHHPHDPQDKPMDPFFQGFGHTVTGADGGYRFRTIRPVAYPGRAPHIHFALSGADGEPFYTQMYVAGAAENAGDFLLNAVRNPQARARLEVPLLPSSAPGAQLAGRFSIVLPEAAP